MSVKPHVGAAPRQAHMLPGESLLWLAAAVFSGHEQKLRFRPDAASTQGGCRIIVPCTRLSHHQDAGWSAAAVDAPLMRPNSSAGVHEEKSKPKSRWYMATSSCGRHSPRQSPGQMVVLTVLTLYTGGRHI